MSAQEPSEEELREMLKQLRVEDMVLQAVANLVSLTGRRLTAEGEKDLEQAHTGIEAIRALLPFCPAVKFSSASRTSVRCRWRISTANFSIDAPSSASEVKNSACRSR